MKIFSYKNIEPKIETGAFIAEGAVIIGKCFLGENSSIWFNTTLRGDVGEIHIGKNTNIQDNSTLHITENINLHVGDSVTVGHGVTLHSCTIGNFSLVGMGSVVLDNVKIGNYSLIAAGSVLPPNKVYGDRKLIRGNPAREVRDLSDLEVEALKESSIHYCKRKDEYLNKDLVALK